MIRPRLSLLCACIAAAALVTLGAQQERLPVARLVSAPRLAMPGAVDSNVPMTWDLVDGTWRLFAFTSWGGVPARLAGAGLDRMQQAGTLEIAGHPGHGIWIESIIPDDSGAWYGYYHHEVPAYECGRPDRSIPRIGSARSVDRGATWQDLGILLEAPPGSAACGSANRYVIGGVGDVSAVLAPGSTDLFLYYSQYSRVPAEQGVMVARLAWADRDMPVGQVTIWSHAAWLSPRLVRDASDGVAAAWDFPTGTPLVAVTQPWHDGNERVDAFWGPSIHWNTYLERYVMLLNRAKDDRFGEDGIYVSYSTTLADPAAWSAPAKIFNGGEWYPQVIGSEIGTGTDRTAGKRARFFMLGRSDRFVEFER